MIQSRIPLLTLALAAGAHGAVKVSLHLPEAPFRGGQTYTIQALVTGAIHSSSCRWDAHERVETSGCWGTKVQTRPVGRDQGVVSAVSTRGDSVAFSARVDGAPRTISVTATSLEDPRASATVTLVLEPAQPDDLADSKRPVSHVVDARPDPYARIRAAEAEVPELMEWGWQQLLNPAHWSRPGTCHDLPRRTTTPGLLEINGSYWNDVVGYGCPAILSWTPPAQGARQLFGVVTGYGADERTLEELDAKAGSHEFTLTRPVQEVRVLSSERDHKGRVLTRSHKPVVRGMVLVAGEPGAAPGHRDGEGWSARFTAPCGIATLGASSLAFAWDESRDHASELRCAVVDPQEHVVRLLHQDGTVRTPWGRAGEEGCVDGAYGQARFRRPTGVAVRVVPLRSQSAGVKLWGEELIVSDTGNHALRRIDPQGRVTTLAGNGFAGYRDAKDARVQAQFNGPRGVAVDRDGTVYVADAGNHAIRGIRGGQVFTVAGTPGQPGIQDGPGDQAQFSDLNGLTLDSKRGDLYVTDGHAARRIRLNQDRTRGQVETLLGQVGRAVAPQDFRAFVAGADLLAPCLNNPQDLAWTGGALAILDTYQHVVRQFDPERGTLVALAGDPARRRVRCGRFRDGVDHLPEAGATLDTPMGVACVRSGNRDSLLVTSGTGVLSLDAIDAHGSQDGWFFRNLALVAPDQVQAGQPCRVAINTHEFLEPGRRPYDYLATLEFLEPDGSVGQVLEGRHRFEQTPWLQGTFQRPGRAALRLTVVTPEGVSRQVRKEVDVVPPQSGPDAHREPDAEASAGEPLWHH